jgi:hypothetical protein
MEYSEKLAESIFVIVTDCSKALVYLKTAADLLVQVQEKVALMKAFGLMEVGTGGVKYVLGPS